MNGEESSREDGRCEIPNEWDVCPLANAGCKGALRKKTFESRCVDNYISTGCFQQAAQTAGLYDQLRV